MDPWAAASSRAATCSEVVMNDRAIVNNTVCARAYGLGRRARSRSRSERARAPGESTGGSRPLDPSTSGQPPRHTENLLFRRRPSRQRGRGFPRTVAASRSTAQRLSAVAVTNSRAALLARCDARKTPDARAAVVGTPVGVQLRRDRAPGVRRRLPRDLCRPRLRARRQPDGRLVLLARRDRAAARARASCDIYVSGSYVGGLSVGNATCNAWSRDYGDYTECHATAHTHVPRPTSTSTSTRRRIGVGDMRRRLADRRGAAARRRGAASRARAS